MRYYDTIIENSATDLFSRTLYELLVAGDRVMVRGLPTQEIRWFRGVLTDPQCRWIQTPERRMNTFASCFETLWVLSGSNDIDLLKRVLPRAPDFSDDGKTWRAGYGKRLLRFGDGPGVNQLDYLLNTLQKDVYSRQAVMSIWNPTEDCVVGSSKDFPCLAGDTNIKSPEGDISIEELASLFERGDIKKYPVYGFDEKTRNVKLTWCTNAWRSGKKKLLKITFDDGSILRVTPDHRVYRKVRKWVPGCKPKGSSCNIDVCEAGDLRVGDSIWATHFFRNGKDRQVYIRHLSSNWSHKNQVTLHRDYYEFVQGSKLVSNLDVHHKDGDKDNHRISNLEVLEHGVHAALKMFGDNNPMKRSDVAKRMGQTTSRVSRERWAGLSKFEGDRVKSNIKKGWANRSPKAKEEYRQKKKDWWAQLHEVERKKLKSGCRKRALLQWKKKKCINNHKIVSIEEDSLDSVYDFEVPETHNAVVGTGVVVHNCSNFCHALVRNTGGGGDKLHFNLKIRSNDLVWGASSINWIEFTVIQELLTLFLNFLLGRTSSDWIQLGDYIHDADSMHIYVDGRIKFDTDKLSTLDKSNEVPFRGSVSRELNEDMSVMNFESLSKVITEFFDFWVNDKRGDKSTLMNIPLDLKNLMQKTPSVISDLMFASWAYRKENPVELCNLGIADMGLSTSLSNSWTPRNRLELL